MPAPAPIPVLTPASVVSPPVQAAAPAPPPAAELRVPDLNARLVPEQALGVLRPPPVPQTSPAPAETNVTAALGATAAGSLVVDGIAPAVLSSVAVPDLIEKVVFIQEPSQGAQVFSAMRPVIEAQAVHSTLALAPGWRPEEVLPAEAAGSLLNLPELLRAIGYSAEDFQRTLRSPEFSTALDRLREDVRKEFDLEKTVGLSVAGVSFGVSVAYALWLIRGGVLMGSYLSALPAWRILDPLPVLSKMADEEIDEDDALDALADEPGNPLRGFG